MRKGQMGARSVERKDHAALAAKVEKLLRQGVEPEHVAERLGVTRETLRKIARAGERKNG